MPSTASTHKSKLSKVRTTKGKPLPVSRITKLGKTPWERMGRLVDDYADRGGELWLGHKGRSVLFRINVFRRVAAHIATAVTSYSMKTLPSSAVRDPPHGFEHVSFGSDSDDVFDIHLITAKPSHNIPNGTYAISLAIAVGKGLGYRRAKLHDSSHINCRETSDFISLRRVMMLSKGLGWYESKGFKSEVESVRPTWVSTNAARIRGIGRAEALRHYRAVASVIRDAILRQPPSARAATKARTQYGRPRQNAHAGRLTVEVYRADHGPAVTTVSSMDRDLLAALRSAETAVMHLSKSSAMTLGAVVAELKDDCKSLSELVYAIMPEEHLITPLTDSGGAPFKRPAWVDAIKNLYEIFRDNTLIIDLQR